ncbi:Flp family type IVb pilin [Enterobacteriaceae bacterium ESL0689]|nr:Flp family type IVb pilin [Enterobacteriaceae bacterium ESL0689]
MLTNVYNKYLKVCTNLSIKIDLFKKSEHAVTTIEYAIVVAGIASVVAFTFATDSVVYDFFDDIYYPIWDKIVDTFFS